jgi:oligogalacturonide lyase
MPRWNCLLAVVGLWTSLAAAQQPPTDWIEQATGHRIIRLSREPGTASLYFHQNPYTASGDKMLVTTRGGLATIDLTTLGKSPPKIETIAEGRAGSPIVGRKSRQVVYVSGGSIYTTHLDTHQTREIVKLPPGYSGASGLAINADETLLASTGSDPKARDIAVEKARAEGKPPPPPSPPPLAAGRRGFGDTNRSMVLFTVNIATGELRPVHYEIAWLNHTQFSTVDPGQLLFCHEGTWQDVDRIWTIRTDGTGLKLMHPRTMPMEIAGHEFFSHDGQMVWYDLQTPRSGVFWLAGVHITSGERIRYPVERHHWSVHFNQSHDGRLFAGDGGGPSSVANRSPDNRPLDSPGNGQWIYLFTPQSDTGETMTVGGEEVKIGKLSVEKLVDLSKHDYNLEPNVTFTPDNKWIVFRSNIHGATHVYAVEVARTQ